MQRHHVLPLRATRRLGRRTIPLLLGGALIVGACSNDTTGDVGDTADGAATTTPPASTIDATPPSTTAPAPVDRPDVEPDDTAPPPSEESPTPDALARVFAELETSGFTGTVMVQSPAGVWDAGFGLADRAAGVANDADTVFDIGSLTKQFTAAAIVRLEMDGRLSVDDAVGDHVEGLRPEQSALTLHQLLTHTAGVPNGLGPDDEVIALDAYVARLANSTGASTPVGEFAYSNVGYSLLGAVIEAVTGASYESYLREALFEPAGMTQTGYVLPDWTDATIAVGYDGNTVFGRPNEQPWDVDGPGWHLRANGGLLSTMPDLLRWDAALRGDEIFDPAAKEKLFAPHVAMDDSGEAFYGYGWVIVPLTGGTPLVQHNGGNGVFFADLWRFPDATIALASNVADPDVFDLGDGLAGLLLDDEPLGDERLGDDAVDEEGICVLDSPSSAATDAFERIADFPDTPAGRAMAAWIDVLLAGAPTEPGAESMLRAYLLTSVDEHVLDELGIDVVVAFIGSLQRDFANVVVERIHHEDESTFHVVVADRDGQEAVLSARVGDAPEWRIDCVGLPA